MIEYNNDIANYIEKVIIPYTLAFLIVKNNNKFNFYLYYKYIIKLFNIKNPNYKLIRTITKNILKIKYNIII